MSSFKAEQPSGVSAVASAGQSTREAAMRTDQDFLLYPLGTEDRPHCPACGKPMTLALHEARTDRPDFSTFRCQACTRSERFVFEN
jgi:transposase-like protein